MHRRVEANETIKEGRMIMRYKLRDEGSELDPVY